MIVKDGESIAHLKIRIEKELSDLKSIDPKLAEEYQKEAVRDIFNSTLQEKFDVPSARKLIEHLDPDFYTKPNQLRKSTMTDVYINGAAILLCGVVGIISLVLTLSVIASF
jgi:hypothetical protein